MPYPPAQIRLGFAGRYGAGDTRGAFSRQLINKQIPRRWAYILGAVKARVVLALLRLDEGAKHRIDARLIAPSLPPKPSENIPV